MLRIYVVLLGACLSSCAPLASSLDDPNPGGIGFGEELFKLQGRVDYLYGHVLRKQKKLELQVGELQRSVQSLQEGNEVAGVRRDLVSLRDEIIDVKREIKSISEELPAIKAENASGTDQLSSLKEQNARALRKQEEIETRIKSLTRSLDESERARVNTESQLIALRHEVKKMDQKIAAETPQVTALSPARMDNRGDLPLLGRSQGSGKRMADDAERKRIKRGQEKDQSVLASVHFPAGSSQISREASRLIGKVAAAALRNGMRLSIVSILPSVLGGEKEQRIATARAQAVYDKLHKNGVSRERISSLGFEVSTAGGEKQPRVEIRKNQR